MAAISTRTEFEIEAINFVRSKQLTDFGQTCVLWARETAGGVDVMTRLLDKNDEPMDWLVHVIKRDGALSHNMSWH